MVHIIIHKMTVFHYGALFAFILHLLCEPEA